MYESRVSQRITRRAGTPSLSKRRQSIVISCYMRSFDNIENGMLGKGAYIVHVVRTLLNIVGMSVWKLWKCKVRHAEHGNCLLSTRTLSTVLSSSSSSCGFPCRVLHTNRTRPHLRIYLCSNWILVLVHPFTWCVCVSVCALPRFTWTWANRETKNYFWQTPLIWENAAFMNEIRAHDNKWHSGKSVLLLGKNGPPSNRSGPALLVVTTVVVINRPHIK